jgi:hypothetical protein
MRMQLRRRAWLCALACACTPAGGVSFEPDPGTGGGSTTEFSGSSGGGEEVPPPPPPSSGTGGDTGGPASGATLIPAHASWRFVDFATPVAGEWTALEFDDKAWSEGQAPFGDDASAATPVSAPLGLRLRRSFTAAAQEVTLKLFLRRGDGAAVYLNGAPLVRSNLAADPRPDGASATVDLTGNEPLRYIQLAAPATLLAGDNVIAVEVRRAGPGAPGLHFDLQLDIWDLTAAPAELSAQIRTISYGGEYASDNAAVAWIERDGVGVVRTLAVWAEVRREHLVRWRAASSGDITDAMTAATRGRHGTLDLSWDLHDAAGQPAPPGAYRLLVEFTEDDSNKGAPAGPAIAVPFELGDGAQPVVVADQPRFADLLLVAP